MAKKKRTTAEDLVGGSLPYDGRFSTWVDRLCPEDTAYVTAVIEAMRVNPGAAIQTVARKLKEELSLAVGVGTIARTLKEKVHNG